MLLINISKLFVTDTISLQTSEAVSISLYSKNSLTDTDSYPQPHIELRTQTSRRGSCQVYDDIKMIPSHNSAGTRV